MIRRTHVLFLLLLMFGSLGAQRARVDSLVREIARAGQDTAKVVMLNQVAKELAARDPAEAIGYATQAINLAELLDYPRGAGKGWAILGAIYLYQDVYSLSLESSMKSIEYYRRVSDSTRIAWAYNNIGSVYIRQEKFDMALEKFQHAHAIFEQQGLKRQSASTATNIAIVYTERKDYEAALKIYRNNLALFEEIDYQQGLAFTKNNIGILQERITNYQEAYNDYLEAYKIYFRIGNNYEAANTLNNLSGSLLKLNQPDQAMQELERAREIIEHLGSEKLKYENSRLISEVYKSRGDFETALAYHEEFSNLRDSLFNATQNEKIIQLDKQFEIRQRDAQIALLNKDKAVQRASANEQRNLIIALIVGFGMTFLLVLALFAINRVQSRSNRMLSEKNMMIEDQKISIEMINKELKAKNERLEDLMREKDGLIGIVAHDLKSPLARSAGLAELIEMSGDLTEEQKSYLDLIRKTTAEGGELIKDLLDLNQIEHSESPLKLAPLNLADVVKESATTFRGEAAKKGIQLHLNELSDVEIKSDRQYISRILSNLISNALKFSPEGKTVEISARRNNGSAEFFVKDEGPGISREDQQKMFKKFQKLSAKPTAGESSTGLGLSITKALVERLEGKINVDSELGKGTVFKVSLPRN